MMDIYNQYTLSTPVIAAGIRHPISCLTAAKAVVHIVTVPYSVLLQMANHTLIDIGTSRYLNYGKSVSL